MHIHSLDQTLAGSEQRYAQKTSVFINATLFQLAWFACVIGGNAWAAIAVSLLLLAHFVWFSRNWSEWRVIFLVCAFGITVDSACQALGLIEFYGHGWPIPLWLGLLWLAFATTLNHCFSRLNNHIYAAAALGGIGGPLSYLAGIKLGAANTGLPLMTMFAALGLVWAVLFPAALRLMDLSTRRHQQIP